MSTRFKSTVCPDLHPAQAHDEHDQCLGLDTHLQIPHHEAWNWYDDKVHENAESTTRENEGPGIDASASWDCDFTVGIVLVHLGTKPSISDGIALERVSK